MTAPPLAVRGLSKRYRKRVVLADFDLTVEAGEAVALIGANGAGKSTLLGCMAGDRLPTRGEVRVCGIDPLSDPAAAARCTGWVPERAFLYDELTVGELLAFVVAARGMDAAEGHREARRLLERLRLAGADDVLCGELSQGMRRKVAITTALLHAPRLLLLDETLNGLDVPSAGALLEELNERRHAGAGVLIASHDLAFLARWCERGVSLREGGEWKPLRASEWDAWRADPELSAGGGENLNRDRSCP